ncbi:uncharacterized protein LOC124461213 isoform X2 [Drosophila willistoni]|uniref:uncharacterized protein LOC124461213 isoform X2 n=1 Tax=Drosophila willistoni TaxID=7260 RepID=UPI001F086C70|nr:uncharacterized protein LOC124461213 isoform X2 [Drosophila willistoni]
MLAYRTNLTLCPSSRWIIQIHLPLVQIHKIVHKSHMRQWKMKCQWMKLGAPNTDFLQPMRTFGYFRNGHGEDIPVSFVLGPDGLVTNVSMVSEDNGIGLPLDQQMESLTAAQLDQILQSGRTYLAFPPTAKSSSSSTSSSAADRKIVPKKVEEEVPDDEGHPRKPTVKDEADYEEIGVCDTFAVYWANILFCD